MFHGYGQFDQTVCANEKFLRRNKIGADPNNTSWAKSTSRFGHKILSQQGWTPGSTLGAANASHASHYTSASSSHIRVLLRDDNLGLGAKNGKQDTDRFGLDMFQGLLGRLNGKSDADLQKEQGYRRDLALKELVVKRFGATTFVSGGYLVGDKIERDRPAETNVVEVVAVKDKEKKSKKRKRAEDIVEEAIEENPKQLPDETTTTKEKRKSKRSKKQGNDAESEVVTEVEQEDAGIANASDDASKQDLSEKELKRQRKAERRAAKEAKRKEKEERRQRRREAALTTESNTAASTPVDTSEADVGSDAPASTLQKTAAIARGRFAVRSRYSQQKRMAVADQQALKEIFMIKTGA